MHKQLHSKVLGWWGSTCGLMQTLHINGAAHDAVHREGCREVWQGEDWAAVMRPALSAEPLPEAGWESSAVMRGLGKT